MNRPKGRAREFGEVLAVRESLAGGSLATDVSSGATTLVLDDASEFGEEETYVVIRNEDGDEEVVYALTVDPDIDTLTLEAPGTTQGWVAEETMVFVWPEIRTRFAEVAVYGAEDDAVTALVPSQCAQFMLVGTREDDERERVTIEHEQESGHWVVRDVYVDDPDANPTEIQLGDLLDVDTDTALDGYILVYEADTGMWEAVASSGGGSDGSDHDVLDHADANTTPAPGDGDVLTWDGTPGEWIAAVHSHVHDHDTDYEPLGAVSTHEGAGNPHPTYLTEAEADALYVELDQSEWTDLTDSGETTLHSHPGSGGSDGSDHDILDHADANTTPSPSDGDVLTWDSTPGEWVAMEPGPPGVPGSDPRSAIYDPFNDTGDDDEFDDESFTGWTAVQDSSPTPTLTEVNDALSILHPGGDSSAELHAWVKSRSVSADDWIETCVGLRGAAQNFSMGGVLFSNGATYGSGSSQQILLGYSPADDAFVRHRMTNFNTFAESASTGASRMGGENVFLRLKFTGTNAWAWLVSIDGTSWAQIAAGSFGSMGTPTHAGIFISTWGGASPCSFRFRYARFGNG